MAEKNINSRIQHKHDIEDNWLKAVNFIPKQGEIIVYDVDQNYSYERIKIGDGIQNVNLLPFYGDSFGSSDVVLYTPQVLTEEQKAQARQNIEAVSESYMKSYIDEAILGGAW